MFQPETEDMLPRAAPKPSEQLNEGNMKPTVPEVSILFGTQQPQINGEAVSKAGIATTAVAKPTYAAWRRQVLPKVTFPPVGAEVTGYSPAPAANRNNAQNDDCIGMTAPRSTLYPMRAAITPTFGSSNNNTTKLDFANNNNNNEAITQQYNQRRSLENAPIYTSSTHSQNVAAFSCPNDVLYPFQQQQQQNLQRRSLDMLPQRQPALQRSEEVLTICAGTQTDFTASPTKSETSLQHLATKEDIESLQATVQTIREEQLRLLQICGALLVQQQQQMESNKRSYCRDIGTQCESILLNVKQPINEQIDQLAQDQPQMLNGFTNPTQQLQTPRAPPQAQSTAYRPNTPRPMQSPNIQFQQEQQENIIATLPQATTEKSAVMNELAFKYLPNEKLNELLDELHIVKPMQQQQQQTPLRNIENLRYDKPANDISNASYKYLKKYRLLPEEVDANHRERNFQQQQQQSPYQHSPRSPLTIGTSPNLRAAQQQEQMLDLENIRNKPKFI